MAARAADDGRLSEAQPAGAVKERPQQRRARDAVDKDGPVARRVARRDHAAEETARPVLVGDGVGLVEVARDGEALRERGGRAAKDPELVDLLEAADLVERTRGAARSLAAVESRGLIRGKERPSR